MGLTTRVGVQTHHRPSNYDGPWLYFENYGNIAPLTARYLPNSYGILVFLLESRPQRRLCREARRRVGRGRGGERANGAEANRTYLNERLLVHGAGDMTDTNRACMKPLIKRCPYL